MPDDVVISFQEWKQNFLNEIDALPHPSAKGDDFVQKVLQIYYNLSEEDAVNATACSGAGDKGIDALHIIPSDDKSEKSESGSESTTDKNRMNSALVVQGKYGTAGTSLQLYQESQKFFKALNDSINGKPITTAVDTAASVIRNGGLIRYVIATVDPLNNSQENDLKNIRVLAKHDFDNKVIVETINLENVYDVLSPVTPNGHVVRKVLLPCADVSVGEDVYLGAASLADIYAMLDSYSKQANNVVDAIYDRNIRKYLKKKTGSVNEGIYKTLENEPNRFIAYNNGITIICEAVQQQDSGLQLDNPYIVNGCQTTRTLYNFMQTNFAGIDPVHDTNNIMAIYRDAFMAFKILVVKNAETDDYAKAITRYSNKQNAVRGKDFNGLEKKYRDLKDDLKRLGYFLEIQTGEFDALPQFQKDAYSPKDIHVINSFEATLFYAAGVLGKPYTTFGRSGDFTPGGKEFDNTIDELTADDLLIPWLIARYARNLGYTAIARRNPQPFTAHRVQTRYFFLFMFFYLVQRILGINAITPHTKVKIYNVLKRLQSDYEQTPEGQQSQHPFYVLQTTADNMVFRYMRKAEVERWYTDRNAYLKQQDLVNIIRVSDAEALPEPRLIDQVMRQAEL